MKNKGFTELMVNPPLYIGGGGLGGRVVVGGGVVGNGIEKSQQLKSQYISIIMSCFQLKLLVGIPSKARV